MEFVFGFLLIAGCASSVSSYCDSKTGPAGSTECVLLTPYYSKYQWATCLTDVYIKAKSNNKHHCRDRSRTYCHYQCMIETHDDGGSGPVFSDCSCDPDRSTPSPHVTLPAHCSSPTGTSCSWYRDCIESRFHCEGTEAAFAKSYGQKFCELYDEYYRRFGNTGKKWIDAVRKCLQVELVPLLRPWKTPSCEEIRSTAFESHSKCYLRPTNNNNELSFCNIGLKDMMRVFWTIKGAMLQAPGNTLRGLFDVGIAGCIGKPFVAGMRKITLTLFITRFTHAASRNKRSIDVLNTDDNATQLIQDIAMQQRWDVSGVAWYGYFERNSSESKNTDIAIFIASKRDYDLNAQNATPVVFNDTIMALADSVKHGKLNLKLSDTHIDVLSMIACNDVGCDEVYLEVMVEKQGTKEEEPTSKVLIIAVVSICSFALVAFLILVIYFRRNLQCNTGKTVRSVKGVENVAFS